MPAKELERGEWGWGVGGVGREERKKRKDNDAFQKLVPNLCLSLSSVRIPLLPDPGIPWRFP